MADQHWLVGLKRIAFPALASGLLSALLLRRMPEKAARQTALCVAVAMMAVSFLYIAGIRYGLFEFLEMRLGLDTKGRALLFANVEPYYEISFTYIGRGTGFERMVEWLSGTMQTVPLRTQTQIHNDFLRMYLNIGFFGYWIWLWSWLPARLNYWFRQAGKDAGCLFLGICSRRNSNADKSPDAKAGKAILFKPTSQKQDTRTSQRRGCGDFFQCSMR